MNLIIDTDVALGVVHEDRPRDIDDAFAIIEAINDDALNLLGVTTVYGNAPLDLVNRAAQELLTVKDASIPIVGDGVPGTNSFSPGVRDRRKTRSPRSIVPACSRGMARGLLSPP